jgi:hypothetical protein
MRGRLYEVLSAGGYDVQSRILAGDNGANFGWTNNLFLTTYLCGLVGRLSSWRDVRLCGSRVPYPGLDNDPSRGSTRAWLRPDKTRIKTIYLYNRICDEKRTVTRFIVDGRKKKSGKGGAGWRRDAGPGSPLAIREG